MEVEDGGKISFLDTLLIVKGQNIIFDGFRKATFSGRYFNFHSNHSLCHKRGVLYGVEDKIFRLCYLSFERNKIN